MSPLHDDASAVLRGWRPPGDEQARLRRRYVDHLDGHRDAMSRDCTPGHLTAGTLVLSADHTHALLTLHAKAHRWFHLGGHCEPVDATLAGAALREATEESGLEGLRLDPEPLHLDEHVVAFCGDHERVAHLDVRFLALALAPERARPSVSQESIDVRWWPVDDLPTDDQDMRVLVDLAVRRAQSSAAS